MDSSGVQVNYCIRTKPSIFVDPEEEVDKLEDEEGKSSSLLLVAVNGGLAGKRKKSSRRNVQWNDHNGDKLEEVFEFQPSDSSDSKNECGCTCNVM